MAAAKRLVLGETMEIPPGSVGEVMRVLRDGEAPVYHLHFDCQPGRIFAVPEAALRALEVTAHV